MTRASMIHVIDDDDAARDSLVFLLEASDYRVQAYESAVAFIDSSPDTDGSCIVTDLRMPKMDGIGLLRELRARSNNCPVIVTTGHADIPLAIEAIAIGAFDFIEKPFDADVLLAALRSALDPDGASATAQTRTEVLDRVATLSSRERQVFDRMALGRSNRAIAHELGYTERVVEVHRANVLTKMQATHLSNLVRMALTLR